MQCTGSTCGQIGASTARKEESGGATLTKATGKATRECFGCCGIHGNLLSASIH
jgi:hypothetical protein